MPGPGPAQPPAPRGPSGSRETGWRGRASRESPSELGPGRGGWGRRVSRGTGTRWAHRAGDQGVRRPGGAWARRAPGTQEVHGRVGRGEVDAGEKEGAQTKENQGFAGTKEGARAQRRRGKEGRENERGAGDVGGARTRGAHAKGCTGGWQRGTHPEKAHFELPYRHHVLGAGPGRGSASSGAEPRRAHAEPAASSLRLSLAAPAGGTATVAISGPATVGHVASGRLLPGLRV